MHKMPNHESQHNIFALFLIMIFEDDLEWGWQINQERIIISWRNLGETNT